MTILSIITVNLNNAPGLRKTVESVVNQTFTEYEYIIIDGGSNDGSVEVIKEFTEKITYWVTEPDGGIYNAMNKGLQQAKGEVVTFLNSGDEYFSRFSLEMAFNFLKTKWSFAELFFFDYIYQSGNNKTLVSSDDVTNKYVIFKKGFGHPSTFYMKRIFELLGGFDESFKISADRDFYMKAIVQNKLTFTYSSFPVSIFHEGGLSTLIDFKAIIKEEDQKIINTYYSYFEKIIIRMPIFKRMIKMKYIGNVLDWLLNWKLKQI